jgi:GNAT superfamily N-acetyltransferase
LVSEDADGCLEDDDWESRAGRVYAPTVRYRSLNNSEIDAAMDWRADLEFALEGGEWPSHDLLAGRIDFLTIRLHEYNVFDILDQFSDAAVAFAELFEAGHLLPEFDEDLVSYDTALILLDVYVAPPFRGRRLGVWMACEVIARMAPSIHTIVFAHPYPRTEGPFEEVDSVGRRKLQRYGQLTGMSPVDGHPRFLSGSPAFTGLGEARHEFYDVRDIEFTDLDLTDPGILALNKELIAGWAGRDVL